MSDGEFDETEFQLELQELEKNLKQLEINLQKIVSPTPTEQQEEMQGAPQEITGIDEMAMNKRNSDAGKQERTIIANNSELFELNKHHSDVSAGSQASFSFKYYVVVEPHTGLAVGDLVRMKHQWGVNLSTLKQVKIPRECVIPISDDLVVEMVSKLNLNEKVIADISELDDDLVSNVSTEYISITEFSELTEYSKTHVIQGMEPMLYFCWTRPCERVAVYGSFNHFEKVVPMFYDGVTKLFVAFVECKQFNGQHCYFKFLVDGLWTIDPTFDFKMYNGESYNYLIINSADYYGKIQTIQYENIRYVVPARKIELDIYDEVFTEIDSTEIYKALAAISKKNYSQCDRGITFLSTTGNRDEIDYQALDVKDQKNRLLCLSESISTNISGSLSSLSCYVPTCSGNCYSPTCPLKLNVKLCLTESISTNISGSRSSLSCYVPTCSGNCYSPTCPLKAIFSIHVLGSDGDVAYLHQNVLKLDAIEIESITNNGISTTDKCYSVSCSENCYSSTCGRNYTDETVLEIMEQKFEEPKEFIVTNDDEFFPWNFTGSCYISECNGNCYSPTCPNKPKLELQIVNEVEKTTPKLMEIFMGRLSSWFSPQLESKIFKPKVEESNAVDGLISAQFSKRDDHTSDQCDESLYIPISKHLDVVDSNISNNQTIESPNYALDWSSEDGFYDSDPFEYDAETESDSSLDLKINAYMKENPRLGYFQPFLHEDDFYSPILEPSNSLLPDGFRLHDVIHEVDECTVAQLVENALQDAVLELMDEYAGSFSEIAEKYKLDQKRKQIESISSFRPRSLTPITERSEFSQGLFSPFSLQSNELSQHYFASQLGNFEYSSEPMPEFETENVENWKEFSNIKIMESTIYSSDDGDTPQSEFDENHLQFFGINQSRSSSDSEASGSNETEVIDEKSEMVEISEGTNQISDRIVQNYSRPDEIDTGEIEDTDENKENSNAAWNKSNNDWKKKGADNKSANSREAGCSDDVYLLDKEDLEFKGTNTSAKIVEAGFYDGSSGKNMVNLLEDMNQLEDPANILESHIEGGNSELAMTDVTFVSAVLKEQQKFPTNLDTNLPSSHEVGSNTTLFDRVYELDQSQSKNTDGFISPLAHSVNSAPHINYDQRAEKNELLQDLFFAQTMLTEKFVDFEIKEMNSNNDDEKTEKEQISKSNSMANSWFVRSKSSLEDFINLSDNINQDIFELEKINNPNGVNNNREQIEHLGPDALDEEFSDVFTECFAFIITISFVLFSQWDIVQYLAPYLFMVFRLWLLLLVANFYVFLIRKSWFNI